MLTLAILAGGMSNRMGQTKAIIPFQGEPLIQRVLDRLAGLADEVIVIAPILQEYLSLDVRIVQDYLPGQGPLGGLYTALLSASNPAVAVVGCDMPFVSYDLLAHEKEILFDDNMDVVVPSTIKGLEPLHAIYRRSNCQNTVLDALRNQELQMISWFQSVKVRILTPEYIKQFDAGELTFLNINTPDELVRLEKMAGEQ
jgi:molybdopterin-guanine dinucleotide biosynthesis protein A